MLVSTSLHSLKAQSLLQIMYNNIELKKLPEKSRMAYHTFEYFYYDHAHANVRHMHHNSNILSSTSLN